MKKKRGGYQKGRRAFRRGDQALLHAIWEAHGGPSEVTRKVNQHCHMELQVQAPINWRVRGKVPAQLAKCIAAALGISPLGLCYETLAALMDKPPSWAEVVKSYGLPKEATDKILFLTPPGKRKRA